MERASWLDALDRLLRQYLPPALAARCRLTNVRDGRLVFLVSAGSWHSALRLHGPKLIEAARGAGLDAHALIVKVATMQPIPRDRTPPAPLSPAARDALRAAASSVSDAELRDQLLRLASLAES